MLLCKSLVGWASMDRSTRLLCLLSYLVTVGEDCYWCLWRCWLLLVSVCVSDKLLTSNRRTRSCIFSMAIAPVSMMVPVCVERKKTETGVRMKGNEWTKRIDEWTNDTPALSLSLSLSLTLNRALFIVIAHCNRRNCWCLYCRCIFCCCCCGVGIGFAP